MNSTDVLEIIEEQKLILDRFRKEGIYYKAIIGLASVPFCYLMHFYMVGKNARLGPNSRNSDELLWMGAIVFTFFLFGTLLLLKPQKLINDSRIKRNRRNLKAKLRDLLFERIPEMRVFEETQQIHPSVFEESKLYDKKMSGSDGDDFMSFYYRNASFNICDIRTYFYFKSTFEGIFGVIYLDSRLTDEFASQLEKSHELKALKHYGDVKFSHKDLTAYVAVKRNHSLFDNKDLKSIDRLNDELEMLVKLNAFFKVTVDLSLT